MDNSEQTDRKPQQPMDKSKQSNQAVAIIMGMITAFISLLVPQIFSQYYIDIVASVSPKDDTTWSLSGRVLQNGNPVSGATIWAILKDAQGNRDSPPTTIADSEGRFIIEPVPTTIAGHDVREITVHGRESPSTSWFAWLHWPKTGEVVLLIGQGSFRRVDFSMWWLVAPAAVFLISLVMAFGMKPTYAYWGAIIAAILLTILTLVEISSGLRYVNTTGEKNEILSLGYASIFRGRYVKDIEPEWLFSLTAPRESAHAIGSGSAGDSWLEDDNAPLVKGFGAPLWVLLLAVAGVGLRTIMIIVKYISDQPEFSNPAEVRSRIEVLVRHQLFMLFAPLGAVFIYQFLVIAESATQPAAVALVSLGAGLTLTTLLGRALVAAPAVVPQTVVATSESRTQQERITEAGPNGQQETVVTETAQEVKSVATTPDPAAGTPPPKAPTT
jgi:hypothetical protein